MWLLLRPPPAALSSRVGRGVSKLAAGCADVAARVGKGRVLGRTGPGRWGPGWSKEAPPAPGSSGPLQLSFAGDGGRAPPPRPRGACSPVPRHSPCGLLPPVVLPPPCCPCCPCAFVGCGPAAPPPGSSQRPPGSGESVAGAGAGAGAFPEVPGCLLRACPALGPAPGAEIVRLCLSGAHSLASGTLTFPAQGTAENGVKGRPPRRCSE